MTSYWYSLAWTSFFFSLFTILVLISALKESQKIKRVLLASLLLAFVGLVFNMTVMGLNQGKMPVNIKSGGEENEAYFEEQIINSSRHTKLSSDTRLPLLADNIYVPFYVPYIGHIISILSIGDVFYIIGVIVILSIQFAMAIMRTRVYKSLFVRK